MRIKSEKKLERIREFVELAEKYEIGFNVDLSIYGNPSMEIIKEAKVLFKESLRRDIVRETSSWIRFHNAEAGSDYISADLKFNIFYPKKKGK